MLELVSVNVTNFRSFAEAEFVPLGFGQGMTAINGPTGMGKSSIVHAITWALFGVTPDGVPVRALRRQGSDGDVVSVVVFRHDGQTIEVTRALRGRSDTTMASIRVDQVEQTNISSKTATAWVQNRLGLDSEAFLTAFVVRQKELDSLIKARPAERRKTIERLAGIERMSAAQDLGRVAARDASKALDALPATEDPAVAEAALVLAVEAETVAKTTLDDTLTDSGAARTTANIAAKAAVAAREAVQRINQARNDVTLATQTVTIANDKVTRLTDESLGADLLDNAVKAVEKTRAARSAAEQAVATLSTFVSQAKQARTRLETGEQDLQRATQAVRTAETTFTADTAAAVLPDGFAEHLAAQEDLLAQTGIDRGAARGEWDRLNKALATLTAATSHGDAECPTCSHVLTDPAALILLQETLKQSVQEKGKELTARFDTLTTAVGTLVAQRAAADAARARALTSGNTLTTVKGALERAAQTVRALTNEYKTATGIADTAAQNAETATTNLDALIDAEATAQTALRVAENANTALQQVAPATRALAAATTQLADVRQALTDAETLLGDSNPAELDQIAYQTENLARDASERAGTANTAFALAGRDLTTATSALNRAVAAATIRQSALSEVERTTAIASALEEFRRDRLARLAPELSEIASDFVSRITNGRFTALELDEEFTPIITEASGRQRPAAWLSGGEESAVALALRVAIGEVLGGVGLLILDEVLTSQDQDRRQAAMAAIRTLPRQVITINHVSEAADMVDLVAEVIDDGEGASTIVSHASEAALVGVLDDALVDA